MDVLIALLCLLVGLVLGGGLVWLRTGGLARTAEQHRSDAREATERAAQALAQLAAAKAELRVQLENAQERERLLARRDAALRESFAALSADALSRNNEAFVQLAETHIKQAAAALHQKADSDAELQRRALAALVDPMAQALHRLDGQLRTVEKEREGAYAELRTQVGAMQATSSELQKETRHLVTALRAPQARGRWGEVQLERIVELAGMVEHCDFTRQLTATGRTGDADSVIRPDLVVNLAGGKQIVVDAKVSLAAFLEATDADDDATRQRRLAAHARHLRAHIDQLSGKSYWAAFENTPEFVVLFVPGDSFLQAALAADPALLEHAFERNIVVATPSTLIALLRTVAHTWRQEALARNAAQVHALGRELHERLATMGEHLSKLGRQLNGSVDAYNRTVGALESRVLVTARKFRDLRLTDEDLQPPDQLDRTPRVLQAPEFESPDIVDPDDLASLLEPRRLRPYGLRQEEPGAAGQRRSTVNE
ncbi:MAG TPA: DNA recombination protein RmuC [Pseudonocardiaceae bacterium]